MSYEQEFLSSYSEYLRKEFQRRTCQNPSYSLRAFARDLDLPVSSVSEVMSGRTGISQRRAHQLATKLGLSAEEKAHFQDLVDSSHARNSEKKRRAFERVEVRLRSRVSDMEEQQFELLSDWRYYVILEALQLKDCEPSAQGIADRTGFRLSVVRELLKQLDRHQLIEWNGEKVTSRLDFVRVQPKAPSQVMRAFHKELMKKGEREIDLQSWDRREYSSTIFSLKKSELEEAKSFLREMRQVFAKKFSRSNEKDEIYCLSMQFFSLLEK